MTATTNDPASGGASMTFTHENPDVMATRADIGGILQALTRILEHAQLLLAEGYSPDVAILAALAEHRPRLALARVTRAAWALALHEGSVVTTREGFDLKGGE